MSNLFSNDRTRGKYGEYALEIILEDIFGAKGRYWFTQYKIESGSIIDFLIKTGTKNENILIDAKFSSDDYMNVLESRGSEELNANFKKNVKNMIIDLEKYINKKDGIFSVIMFLPSESLFYNIMQKDSDLFDFALKNKVWIAGATTLSSILFAQMQVIKEYELNKNAEQIQQAIIKCKENSKDLSQELMNCLKLL